MVQISIGVFICTIKRKDELLWPIFLQYAAGGVVAFVGWALFRQYRDDFMDLL